MSTYDDVSQMLASKKIVALYRVRGGTAQDRYRTMKDLSHTHYMYRTSKEGIESAIWLFEDRDAATTIKWNEICNITELGNDLSHNNTRIITLPDPLDTNYTTYELSEDELIINLLTPFVERELWMPIDEKGQKSLEGIVERYARHTCVVNWAAGNVDATCLPCLPNTVKHLKLCGMPEFLRNQVPNVGACNEDHWIHKFVGKLHNLETLTLSGCGHDPQSLTNLRHRTGLNIKIEKGESEECREKNETDR